MKVFLSYAMPDADLARQMSDEDIPWILRRYQIIRVPAGQRIAACASEIKRALLVPA